MRAATVVLELTQRCNLRCKHCSVDERADGLALTAADWCDIIERLKQIGVRKVVLSGGEPFVFKGFYDVLRHATERFADVGVTSNGILIDADAVDALTRSGATEVQLSVDGMEAEHDWLRGDGTFRKVTDAIGLLKSRGIKVFTMTVLSTVNYRSLGQLCALLDSLGVDRMAIERFTPVGRGKDLDILLSPTELHDIYERYVALRNVYRLSCSDPIFCLDENAPREDAGYFACGGCLAGVVNFAIDNHGQLKPCTRLPHVIGDFRNIDWNDEHYVTNNLLRRLVLRQFDGRCNGCKHVMRCGGCRAEAFAVNGDIFSDDPGCWIRDRSEAR